MKKYFSLTALLLTLIFLSCKKQNTAVNNNSIEGSWSISSFIDNGTDKTAQFVPYTLTFDNKGNMSVNNGGMMMSMCSWSMKDSVYHFNMMSMHNNSMDEMDGDWMLMNFANRMCSFIDNSSNRDCRFTMYRR